MQELIRASKASNVTFVGFQYKKIRTFPFRSTIMKRKRNVLFTSLSTVTARSFAAQTALSRNLGSILNIGVEEKKVDHKSPKSCRIESSNLIFTGGVYALQGLYNKNTGYGTHEG